MPFMSTTPERSSPQAPTVSRNEAVEALSRQRERDVVRHGADEARFRRLSWWLGLARLVLFVIFVVVMIQATRTTPDLVLQGALPTALVFVVVVRVHVLVRRRGATARGRRILAAESAARIAGAHGPGAAGTLPKQALSNLDAGRATLRDEGPTHALDEWVLEDLGIDGTPPSLFELLNTTQSSLGARRLRVLVRTPLLDPAAIEARQDAVDELARSHALRDNLLLAFHPGRRRNVARVPAFLARRPDFAQGLHRVLLGVFAVALLPCLLGAAQVPALLPSAGVVFLGLFLLSLPMRRRAGALRESYLELEPLVRSVVDIARVLEREAPHSAVLRAYRERFRPALHGPSRLPLFLRDIMFLHLHEIGFLYGIIELLTSWDLQWLMSLDARARRVPGHLEGFIEVASDLEALVALAVFAAEQRDVHFPEILSAEAPRLDIHAGEHPLLPPGGVVANDLDLGGTSRLAVVTGSNMSGKSTFLRMVALNTVLGQSGAPVRAARLRLTPLRLYANINVHDSLADGKSYFLVEVERVHGILAAARREPFVLAVFDELFRGTNSTERLAASREIARDLAGRGGLFLLATHELELTRLAFEEAVEGIFALHFRDEIRDGRMVFPYRLYPGVGVAHNALRLLELSGYPGDLVARAREHAALHQPEAGADD